MKKTFKNFIKELFPSKEQKENQRKILRTLSLIVGSIFIAEGIISWFPETFDKRGLIGIGIVLVMMSLLD
ncbi:hypothetical protein KAT80_01810 [Candidatus Pacearchaeota archaeon]|nr:hypothetical protein [Candidatus Pacearchaeota archaeon]